MSTSKSTPQSGLDAAALAPLLALVRAQVPHPEAMTFAEGEAAVVAVLRQLGPQLLQEALPAPSAESPAEKRGPRRFARAGR